MMSDTIAAVPDLPARRLNRPSPRWHRRRVRRSRVALLAVGGVVAVSACAPDLGVSGNGPATLLMDPLTPSFSSMPWPNQIRTNEDGSLNLVDFPGTERPLTKFALGSAAQNLRGFGTTTAIYLRFSSALDETSLPTPDESVTAASPIQIVNTADPSDRVPFVATIEEPDDTRPANLLSLLPFPGHALRSDARYVVAVTTGVRSSDGSAIGVSPLVAALDEDGWFGRARSEADWFELRRQRTEARDALVAGGVWAASDLAGFTAYRTQDSQREMRAITATINDLPAPALPLSDVPPCVTGATSTLGYSTIAVPGFQSGSPPFVTDGQIIVGTGGRAFVQGYRQLPVQLSIPCGPAPAGGWPVVTYRDGSGGSANVFGLAGLSSTAVLASIPPMYGFEDPLRASLSSPEIQDVLRLLGFGSNAESWLGYYNKINLGATRTNSLQQAADDIVLLRALESVEIPGSIVGTPTPVGIDATREAISGQSQGAWTAWLVAAMHPVTAIATGGTGGGIYNLAAYETILHDPLVQLTGVENLDVGSPIAQLAGTLFDSIDPANFPVSGNIVNYSGISDGCAPLESTRLLAGTNQMAVANPQVNTIFGSSTFDPPHLPLPISGNGPDGTTRVSVEHAGGHFGIYANSVDANAFIGDALAGRTPTVSTAAPGYGTGECTRVGPVPTDQP